jgi:aquaporin Z
MSRCRTPGAFRLVFGPCCSAVLAAAFPEPGTGFVGVAFAFGLTGLTMAYAGGLVCGPSDVLLRDGVSEKLTKVNASLTISLL